MLEIGKAVHESESVCIAGSNV